MTISGGDEEQDEPKDKNPDRRGRRLPFVAATVVAAVLLASLWLIHPPEQPTADSEQTDTDVAAASASIAVLPFQDMSSEQDQSYFADGVSEEILNVLAKRLPIKVIARTSSFSFRDLNLDVGSIAEQLGVTHLLEGSIRRNRDEIRIDVRLVRAESGEYLWAERFARELSATNIFSIQSDIATAVADSLRTELSPDDSRGTSGYPTGDLEALEAYFRGRQSMETRRAAELDRAVAQFERAVAIDPAFALAYVSLAETYRLQSTYGSLPRNEALPKMEAAVGRALELDDNLGQAYASLANVQRWRRDYDGADDSFRRGIDLAPNYAPLYQWYGEFLSFERREPELGIPFSKTALTLDPRSSIISRDYGKVLVSGGYFQQGLEQYEKTITIEPTFAAAHSAKARLYHSGLGRIADAIPGFQQAISLNVGSPTYAADLSLAFLDIGKIDEATKWLDRGLELAPDHRACLEASMLLNVYRGNSAVAMNDANHLLGAAPGNFAALRVLRDGDLDKGDIQQALQRYREYYGQFFSEFPVVERGSMPAAVDLALVLMRAGAVEQSEAILQRSIDLFEDKLRMSLTVGKSLTSKSMRFEEITMPLSKRSSEQSKVVGDTTGGSIWIMMPRYPTSKKQANSRH